LGEFSNMVNLTTEGQHMELGWVQGKRWDLSESDYYEMCTRKTSWYTVAGPCRLGATVAGAGPDVLHRLKQFGIKLGVGFQIQDDILNLTGNKKKYGKEIGGDIWEGKRTLILIHLLSRCTESEKEGLRRFLATPRPRRLGKDVRWVYRLLAKYDCIESARRSAYQLAGAALREYHVAYRGLPDSEDKRFVENIIFYMIERNI
jgi:geranylgeranyl diphosphate synthase type II